MTEEIINQIKEDNTKTMEKNTIKMKNNNINIINNTEKRITNKIAIKTIYDLRKGKIKDIKSKDMIQENI